LTVDTTDVTRFDAEVGQNDRLSRLVTDAGAGSTILGGDVFTTDGVKFNDNLVIKNNVAIDGGAGPLFFRGTIDGDGNGPWDLDLETSFAPTLDQAPISFGGSIGAVHPLHSLSLNTSQPAGPAPPGTSTIVFADGFNSDCLIDAADTNTGTTFEVHTT